MSFFINGDSFDIDIYSLIVIQQISSGQSINEIRESIIVIHNYEALLYSGCQPAWCHKSMFIRSNVMHTCMS